MKKYLKLINPLYFLQLTELRIKRKLVQDIIHNYNMYDFRWNMYIVKYSHNSWRDSERYNYFTNWSVSKLYRENVPYLIQLKNYLKHQKEEL